MYVIDPNKCSHPAQVREGNAMKCLVCGAEIKPPKKQQDKKQQDKKPDDKKGEDKTE